MEIKQQAITFCEDMRSLHLELEDLCALSQRQRAEMIRETQTWSSL